MQLLRVALYTVTQPPRRRNHGCPVIAVEEGRRWRRLSVCNTATTGRMAQRRIWQPTYLIEHAVRQRGQFARPTPQGGRISERRWN